MNLSSWVELVGLHTETTVLSLMLLPEGCSGSRCPDGFRASFGEWDTYGSHPQDGTDRLGVHCHLELRWLNEPPPS